MQACIKIRGALEAYLRSVNGVKLLGPAPGFVLKVKNRYKYRIIVRCDNTKTIRETIAHTVREFSRDSKSRGVTVYADAGLYE